MNIKNENDNFHLLYAIVCRLRPFSTNEFLYESMKPLECLMLWHALTNEEKKQPHPVNTIQIQ